MRCANTADPSTASTRLPVCTTSTWRIQPSALENSIPANSAAAITASVDGVRCTITLSMIVWLASGTASAMSWTTKEAISTSRQTRRWRASSGTNQRKPNPRAAAPVDASTMSSIPSPPAAAGAVRRWPGAQAASKAFRASVSGS